VVRSFIRDPHFPLAAGAFAALRELMPDGSTVHSRSTHLKAEEDDVLAALALLDAYAAVEINDHGIWVAPKFFWEKAV
jgi:hypothetical protein